VVVSLAPVLTATFAALLLPNERLGPFEIGGFALGILGVIVIADPMEAGLGSSALLGVALAFAGAAAFSLGAVLLRPLRTDLPRSPRYRVGDGLRRRDAARRGRPAR